MSLGITPSQSAPSPQSPQKIRNSASIGRRRPTSPNHETAVQAVVPSITTGSHASRVSSGSTTPARSSSGVGRSKQTKMIIASGSSTPMTAASTTATWPAPGNNYAGDAAGVGLFRDRVNAA